MNAEHLIAALDRTISMLRREWLESKGKDRQRWMGKINEALDDRLELMKLRDANRHESA